MMDLSLLHIFARGFSLTVALFHHNITCWEIFEWFQPPKRLKRSFYQFLPFCKLSFLKVGDRSKQDEVYVLWKIGLVPGPGHESGPGILGWTWTQALGPVPGSRPWVQALARRSMSNLSDFLSIPVLACASQWELTTCPNSLKQQVRWF